MIKASAPKKGQRFIHRNWLNEDHTPLEFEISAIRDGIVYFRPVYTDGLGKPHCCNVDELERYMTP